MKSRCWVVLVLTMLVHVVLPVAAAAALSRPWRYNYYSESARIPSRPAAHKRSKGVDVWSICPPQMTDVECFYAYLRVYARLRKAAEESDRVSMRNIGKRSSVTSALESEQAKSRLRRLHLCADDLPPALCYHAAKQIYQRVLGDLNTRL